MIDNDESININPQNFQYSATDFGYKFSLIPFATISRNLKLEWELLEWAAFKVTLRRWQRVRKSIAEEAEAAMSVEGGGGGGGLRAAPPWRGGEEEEGSSVAINEGGDFEREEWNWKEVEAPNEWRSSVIEFSYIDPLKIISIA